MVNGLSAMSFSVEWIEDCFLLNSCGVSCSVHLNTSRTQRAEGSSFSSGNMGSQIRKLLPEMNPTEVLISGHARLSEWL